MIACLDLFPPVIHTEYMVDTAFALGLGERYLEVADVHNDKKAFGGKSLAFNEIPFNLYASASEEVFKKAGELLRALISDSEIKKQDVNIVIPDSQSYTRIFEMPMLTDKELLSAIKYQADQFIPIPIDKVSLDVHILHKDKVNKKVDILLVAAPNTVIENVVQLAESASLLPVSIENEASATLRLLSALHEMKKPDPQDTTEYEVFINFGNSSSSIYLFDVKQQRALQMHNFNIGQSIFYRDIQSNYSLEEQKIKELIETVGFAEGESTYNLHQLLSSPLNELVSEIKRFLMSAKQEISQKPKKLYLFGEGSKFAHLDEKLSSLLGETIAMVNLTEYFEKSSVTEYFANDWPLLVPVIGGAIR